MPSCLGIYVSENTIKYAKLATDSANNVRLDHYGTRIVKAGKKDIIDSIISETSSNEIPIVINVIDEKYSEVSIFDQAQESQYSPDIMKMEFETWCETNQKSPEKYDYVYKLSNYRTTENKHNGVICISSKDAINDNSNFGQSKAVAEYPNELLYTDLAPEEIQSYIIVNLDERLTIETVINRKMFDYKFYDIGMKNILEKFEERLGSYQKAYTACKQLNVYTEGESTNDQELERIAEPILQEILKNISSVTSSNKDTISRVYITGIGTIFNNLDVLLTEYLEIKAEILKPNFLTDTSDVRNVSEMLETTQAMAMAYNYLIEKNKFLNFLRVEEKEKKKNFFTDIAERFKGSIKFDKKKEKSTNVAATTNATNVTQQKKNNIFNGKFSSGNNINSGTSSNVNVNNNEAKKASIQLPTLEKNTLLNVMIGVATFTAILLIAYSVFTVLYTSSTNKMIDEVTAKIKSLGEETAKVNSDITYIKTNINEYTEINENVDLLVSQIVSGQIGKISTYNVATFLQKIIKVIPKGVTLDTVKSDDNKHVAITMYSAKYADLGYFVAQLKLNGILNSVEVKNISNSTDKITIEIGGELP